jgi:hypothetical protein
MQLNALGDVGASAAQLAAFLMASKAAQDVDGSWSQRLGIPADVLGPIQRDR